MKVLALVTDAYGGYGGIAQYNRDFLEALASLPQVIDLQVLPRIAPEQALVPPGVTQYQPIFNRVAYGLRAAQIALRQRPDLIFSGHIYHGPLAAKLSSLLASRLVSQLHGTEVWRPLRSRHLLPLTRSAKVLCVSHDTKERYLAQSPVGTSNATVLHNTVSPTFTIGDRTSARAMFDLTDEFAILTVARLDSRGGYKGHDRVIHLLPQLIAMGLKPIYFVAGIGDDLARLKSLAYDRGVTQFVKFVGKVDDGQLRQLYRAADLFALPSNGEGFGIAFIEATAAGTPAIGLAVGGATDALVFPPYAQAVPDNAFEAQFIEMSVRCLSISEPERTALSAATQKRFGHTRFRSDIARVLANIGS